MQTFFPTIYQRKVFRVELIAEGTATIQVDWKGAVGELEQDLLVATWVSGPSLTLSNDTTSGTVGSINITTALDGCFLLEAFGHFADGQTRKQQFEIEVRPRVSV